jgi:glycosyltransferase involved in cell wall biosynthesis
VPRVHDAEIWTRDGSDANSILFVGRFDRVKGADTLLQAFSKVAQDKPALRLIFIGPDVGLIQGGRTVTYKDYVAENLPPAVHEQIQFKGVLTRPEIAEHRRRAAFTIVSSRYETFSMTVVEAMAAGSPLIASRAGGIKEIIRDGDNGMLFDAEDPDGLVEQIERLLIDRDLAARLGEKGRSDASARFSEAEIARFTYEFYQEISQPR